ncbi:MAG: hypothetical protein RL591_2170, partial [Planctomycetota bacterium]
GTLVQVEGTVDEEFSTHGFAVDILSRHFDKEPIHRCVLRDIRFIAQNEVAGTSQTELGGFVANGAQQQENDQPALAVDPLKQCRLTVSISGVRPSWRVADRVRVIGVMRGIAEAQNPHSRSFRTWAARHRIVGSLFVESADVCTVLTDWRSTTPIQDAIDRLRASLREKLRAGLLAGVATEREIQSPSEGANDRSHRDAGIRSMLVALVLGDSGEGYAEIENAFRATGLAHILAISGFNLAVLGWIVGFGARLIFRDTRLVAACVMFGAFAALFVMAPAPSAERSALMAVVGSLGSMLRRDWHGDAILAIVAGWMILCDPAVASNAGFQLSFGCVLALRHLAPRLRRAWLGWIPGDAVWQTSVAWRGIVGEYFARSIASGVAAFGVGTSIALAHFGSMQPAGILLTFLCAPLSTATLAIAYPKAIVGSISETLVWPLGYPLQVLLSLQIALVDQALTVGGGGWALQTWIAQPLSTRVVCAGATVGGVVLLFCAKQWRIRLLACGVTALGVWIGPTILYKHFQTQGCGGDEREPMLATMTTFAIGDGSAHLFSFEKSIVIFDVGSSSIGSAASRVMLPEIQARGGVVEALIISHPDLDHYSGAADLIRFARVRRLVVHDSMLAAAERSQPVRELFETATRHGVALELVAAGDQLTFGCSQWNVLWPPKGLRTVRDNDVSLVMRVDLPSSCDESSSTPDRDREALVETSQQPRLLRGAVLLCGDIETLGCASLLSAHEHEKQALTATVMELPHHGSWRDAVVPLIHRCNPSVILQSTATRRFLMDRFAGVLPVTSSRLVTCRDGAVHLEFRVHEVRSYVYDRLALRQWRPAGRWRRTRKSRLMKVCVRVVRRWNSAWRKQRRTLEHDAVANDAVSTVAQLNNNDWLYASGSTDHERLCSRRPIEHKSLGSAAFESDRDLKSHVYRCGFHDADNSCQQCLFRRIYRWRCESNRARTFHGDIGAPEKKALTPLHTPQVCRAVEIAVALLANLLHRTCRQRSELTSIKYSRDRVCGAVVRSWLRPNFREPVARKLESPTSALLKGEISSSNERTIGCPNFKASSRLGRHFRQSDRRDTIHSDLSSRGAFFLRLLCLIRRLCNLARFAIRCWNGLLNTARRGLLLRAMEWFIWIGVRTYTFQRRWEGSCGDRKVLTDRIDESANHVPIDEERGIGVSRLRSPSIGDHPKARNLLEIDGQRADPTVIPVRDAIDYTKASRDPLTVDGVNHTERKRSDTQERSFTLLSQLSIRSDCRTQTLATNHEGDDLVRCDVALRNRACIANQERPRVCTNRMKSPECPPAIAEQNADDCGVGFIANNRFGFSRPFPLRFLQFSSDIRRKDDLGLEYRRAQRRTCEGEGCDSSKQSEDPTCDQGVAASMREELRKSNQHRVAHTRRHARRFPGRWLRRISHNSPLALEDREVSLRHLEHDERHRGAVRLADLLVGPRAVRILLGDEFLADRRPPVLPSFATSEIHRLHRVVVPVKVMLLGESNTDSTRAAWERIARQVVESAIDRLILVDTRIKEARNARRCARPRRSAYLFHVTESPVVVLTRSNVSDRVVNGRLRNLDSSVASTSECHDLANRDRNIGIRGNRVVAPATLVVLATHDELHGADQRVTNPIVVLVHPVNLTEEQRRESVTVHRTVRVVGNEKTGFSGMRQDEIECLLDAVAKLAATGHIAVRHEGDRAQTCDTHMLTESALTEGSIRLLHPAQCLEPALDRFLKFRRDLLGKRCVLRPLRDGARGLDGVLLGRIRGLLRSRGLTLVLRDEIVHTDDRGCESSRPEPREGFAQRGAQCRNQSAFNDGKLRQYGRWRRGSSFLLVPSHERNSGARGYRRTTGRYRSVTLWCRDSVRGPPSKT